MIVRRLIATILILGLALAVGFAGCSPSSGEGAEKPDALSVYSGAGLRKAMDDIGEAFEEEYGIKIEYTYAGSAQNLSQVELTEKGDVYVPGARYYAESAKKKGLIDYEKNIALHVPVIAVPEGNPAGIETLEDLAKSGVEVVLADAESAAIGKNSKNILQENGLFESVMENVIAQTATANELVVYVSMEQADAIIIWEDNVHRVEGVEIVQIEEQKNKIKTIPSCVLTHSENIEWAKKFVDFMASDAGRGFFEKHGFRPVE